MKKTIASIAIALTTLSAVPAKAGDIHDFVGGAMGLLILKEVFRPYPQHAPQPGGQVIIQQAPPVYQNNTTVIIQDSAWASDRVCSEEIVNSGGGVRSTIQRNCAGRVVGVIDYKRY